MTKKLKRRGLRILAGAALFAAAVLAGKRLGAGGGNLAQAVTLLLFLIPYAVSGGDVVKKAVQNIARGQVFDENFLMTLATLGAFAVGEYPEAVAVMLFYQVGEWFQSYAVHQSRKSIAELMDIRPDSANVLRDGGEETVDPEEVAVGERIRIKAGERIPLDGIIRSGRSVLDTMALTGESLPREAAEGDPVISGCVNLQGMLEVEVTKAYGESTVSKILELVENASSRKAESEQFISRFARVYTPAVVVCALLLALCPPLVAGGMAGTLTDGALWTKWIYRALTFLVISCPCALVISIPLSFFGGLGGAGRNGILIKGSNYLEALAQAEIVAMDKTGTLTKGTFSVSRIEPAKEAGCSSGELLELAALAESASSHPISRSLQAAYGREPDPSRLQEAQELAGYGVHVRVDGREVYAGNRRLMQRQGIDCPESGEPGTVVHVAADGVYQGCILIADELREDAAAAIESLKASGVRRIVMLTGDREETARAVAERLGISEVHAQLLPEGKVAQMEALLAQCSGRGRLVFVGDGMNDAPVLARADIGVAMGGLGSDAAIEAADVVIMTDEPSRLPQAIRLSRRTLRIVRENVVFAIGVKLLILLLAAAGLASMWAAVFADVGVAVIAILNAMRALKA